MIRSMNIASWVQRWSDLHPDKTAIIFENKNITYSELHRRANRTACWLQSVGIEKGDRVAVLLNNCPEFLEIYFACCRLGAIFVPINFRSALPEIDYFLNNSRPRLFIFGREYADQLETLNLKDSLPPFYRPVSGLVTRGQGLSITSMKPQPMMVRNPS